MGMISDIITAWRLKRALSIVNKENPAALLSVTGGPGGGEQPQQFDMTSHLAVYMVNAYAYACIRAIARDVSATPMLVQKHKRVDGELRWITVEEGPLFDLINRPNNEETWTEMTERWVVGLMAAGGSPIVYNGVDKELFFVQPNWVKVVVDGRGRRTGYTITNKGLTINQDTDQIIYAKLSNPSGDYYGLPPSEVIKASILTDISLDEYLKRFFTNNTILGLILTTPGSLTDDQKKIIRKELRKVYAGIKNSFKDLILEKGTTVDRLTQNVKDLVPNEVDQRVMRKVLAAYGVPPVKIGVLDGASYANANKQDQIYERGTADPIRRNLEGVLNLQFVQVHFGMEWRLKYDRSEVVGLQEDRTEKSTRVRGEWKDGLIRMNEARTAIGYDPIEDDEGGSNFFVAQPGFMLTPPSDDANGQKLFLPKPSPTLAVKDVRADQWKVHDKKLVKNEKRYAQDIANYFDDQLDRLLEFIRQITGDGKMMSMIPLSMMSITRADDLPAPDIPPDIFNREIEDEFLRVAIGPSVAGFVEQAGHDVVSNFGLNFDFNVNNPEVQILIETFKNKVTIMNDFTFEQLKSLLKESSLRGDSIQQISRSIQDMYQAWTDKSLDNYRAMRIARTEMNGMVNGGAKAAYDQADLGREWLATMDDATRLDHVYADGQVVGKGEKFAVGGDMLDNPGDPSGSAGNIINCRCTMLPVIQDEN